MHRTRTLLLVISIAAVLSGLIAASALKARAYDERMKEQKRMEAVNHLKELGVALH